MNSLFYSHVDKNSNNESFIDLVEQYASSHIQQIYLINEPLGEKKYSYEHEDNFIVLLSPKHKIMFLQLSGNEDDFNEYYEDFIEDLGAISDKFEYKRHIGRPRKWQGILTSQEKINLDSINLDLLFSNNKIIDVHNERKCELLISLLIGSINNIDKIGAEEPNSVLEKIKRKIVLFDGEQTRFIYQIPSNKVINIQGLSGTGKTELLLHKLKESYISSDTSKILFTCHNKILAANLRRRIHEFFNFMKVVKQIAWNERLWVIHAWGSQVNINSGAYRYICDFYNIEFYRYSFTMDFDRACKLAIESLKEIENFEYAFDYILIDESQDFPDSFFQLCEKVTREKVYIVGDIFQDIFEGELKDKIVKADFILNRCYRTAPRTLMFAHSLGMGLFESSKINWLTDEEWNACGYITQIEGNTVRLYRESIRRFEDLNSQDVESMKLEGIKGDVSETILTVIRQIKLDNPTVNAGDIAIIFLDSDKYIYKLADILEFHIPRDFGWDVNKGYESKEKIDNSVFISNRNNVKGLEFPFVICVTKEIRRDPRYRNILYTMLTRSFIQSYLLVQDETNLDCFSSGLGIINSENCIKTLMPSPDESEQIRKTIIKYKEEMNISYEEFLNRIFNELKIESKHREKFKGMISETLDNSFDKSLVVDFINVNKKFFK